MKKTHVLVPVLIAAFMAISASLPAQEYIYGATQKNSQNGIGGTIYRIDSETSAVTTEIEFPVENVGATNPFTGLIKHSNGLYYGASGNPGVIYEYNQSTEIYTVLYEFTTSSGGFRPNGELIEGSNGNLYGVTYNGPGGSSFLYEYNVVDDIYTPVKDLGIRQANGALVEVSAGVFYGSTQIGGFGQGVIFKYDLNQDLLTEPIVFNGGGNGAKPSGALEMVGADELYGTTKQGGSNNGGVLFKYDTRLDQYTVLYEFSQSTSGSIPNPPLLTNNGMIYGTCLSGGTGSLGTLYKYDPNTTNFTILKNFNFNDSDGGSPSSELIQSADGNIYGVSQIGGLNVFELYGNVFKLNVATDAVSNVGAFNTSNGERPIGTLAEISSGVFLGTTSLGGSSNQGVIFEINASNGNITKKIDMNEAPFGFNIAGALKLGKDDLLYGVTKEGGLHGGGTLFSFDPENQTLNHVYSFEEASGMAPDAGITVLNNTLIYGVTRYGGSNSGGTLFEYNLDTDAYTILHNFQGSNGTLSSPLIVSDIVYGTDSEAGTFSSGIFYEFDLNTSTYSTLENFEGGNNGGNPRGDLLLADNGRIYGVGQTGGTSGKGIIYRYEINNELLAKEHDFSIGSSPAGGLVQGVSGPLYGVTEVGGANNEGIIFSFAYRTVQDPNGIFTKLYDCSTTSGTRLLNGLYFDGSDILFGEARNSQGMSIGESFKFQLSTTTYTSISTTGYEPVGGLTQYCNAPIVTSNQSQNETTCPTDNLTLSFTAQFEDDIVWKKDGTIIPNETSSSFTITSATTGDSGLYTMEASNNCETTIGSVQVTVNDLEASTTITDAECFGDLGSVTISASGGTMPYQYSIAGSGNSQASPEFNNLVADSYQFEVFDQEGCSIIVNATVSEPDELTVATSKANISCYGLANGAIVVTPNGGTAPYEYSLDGISYDDLDVFFELVADTYTVHVRDANGCEATKPNVVITEPAETVFSVSTTNATCEGSLDGEVTINVTSGVAPYTFRLVGGADQSSNVFSGLNPGIYNFRITNADVCITEVQAVEVQADVTIASTISTTDVSCFGEADGTLAVTASGGTAPYEFSIDGSNFQSSATFSALVAGAYDVTVRDDNGCSGMINFSITEPDALEIDVTQNGGDFTVTSTGGTAPYEYKVDGGAYQSSGTFNNLAPGDHSFTVKDANGCETTSSVFSIILGSAVSLEPVIYPNPTTNEVSVEGIEYSLAKVYGLNGQLLKTFSQGDRINLGNLEEGMYLINFIKSGRKIRSVRIRKKSQDN